MPEDRASLIEDIRALLAAKPGRAGLERVEETLTAGYAHAMALEAEQWRLERRLRDAARGGAEAAELTRVADVLAGVERDLGHLRALLASLRDLARELRAAAV
jgi:hypothetical protein